MLGMGGNSLALLAVALFCCGGAHAWGGLFNRFSPEMLANLGYGGHGGGISSYRGHNYMQGHGDKYGSGDILDMESNGDVVNSIEEEQCYGKSCVTNEFCCPGLVCVYNGGGMAYSDMGTCVFGYGRKMGELCRVDNDCQSGLMCEDAVGGEARVCRPPSTARKQYSEECTVSGECDIGRGLCCQVQRRHRQAPRKMCSYFKDPLVCIGPVAMEQVKNNDMQHTAGEKRITSYKHFLH